MDPRGEAPPSRPHAPPQPGPTSDDAASDGADDIDLRDARPAGDSAAGDGSGGRTSPDDRTAPGDRESRPGAVPKGLVRVVALLAVTAVSIAVIVTMADRLNPLRGLIERRTIDRSGPAVVRAINDLGEFRAASGYYELIIDVEQEIDPIPSILAGERTLFVAAGTVEAGVDMRDLPDDAVRIDADRTRATITLPPPSLSPPRVDTGRSYIASQQRGLLNRLRDATSSNPDDSRRLYALADQRLTQAAAATPELRTRAETNTRLMLEGLLRSLGFTEVTVQFAAAGP